MELGSSPMHQADDVEFDLDDLQNPFEDMNHSRLDEGVDFSDPMRHEESNFDQQDDDMVDEDLTEQYQKIDPEDLDMENQGRETIEDEDVLYDEEEFLNTTAMDEEPTEAGNSSNSNSIELSNKNATQDDQRAGADDQIAQPEKSETEAARLSSESHPVEPVQPSEDPALTHGKEDNIPKELEDNAAPETDVVDFALEHEFNEQEVDDQQNSPEILPEDNEPFNDTEPNQESNENENNNRNDDVQPSKLPEKDGESVIVPSPEQEATESLDTDTPQLHAVQVAYFDQHMSLFPPRDGDESTTFFLQDTSLAYESFDKLLAACRDFLGDSLGHDDEIVFDVPALGLHICEDSKYASQLTLAQVIDTYMLLSQNEQLSSIDPLYCQLSHRVCLASQVAYLASSAREGKTFSDIAADYLDTPEPENIDPAQDEFDHQNTASGHGDTETDVENVHDTFEEPEQDQLFGEEEYDTNRVDDIPKTGKHEDGGDVVNEIEDSDLQSGSLTQTNSIQEPTTQPADEYDSKVTELGKSDSHRNSETSQKELNENVPQPAHDDLEQLDFNEEEYLAFTDDESMAEDKNDSNQSGSNTNQVVASEADARISEQELSNEPELKPDTTTEDDFNFEVEDFSETNGNGNINTTAKAPPITPSKLQNGKRRAFDDDEDLEIDISTPEPKRRRAS